MTTVAVEEGRIWGFATVGPARDSDAGGVGELYAICVDPSRWGRGLGQALIGEARWLLAEGGHTAALLWVLAGNSGGASLPCSVCSISWREWMSGWVVAGGRPAGRPGHPGTSRHGPVRALGAA